jgi:hypothetical protein
MYKSREGSQYDPDNDTLRDLSIVPQIEECAEIYQKQLKGEKTSDAQRQLLANLEDKGYHPINNPFFNAPFGDDNHIYNTPTDLMH